MGECVEQFKNPYAVYGSQGGFFYAAGHMV